MEKKFVVLLSADSSEDTAVYTVHGEVRTEDINDAVYQTMCHVAQDVLERSTCLISGDRTASEIAGKIGYLNVLMPLTDEQHKMAPQTVLRIGRYERDRKDIVPQYTCQFPTDMVFEMVAEWEGIASIKKPHLFGCECRDERLNKEKLTIYKRSHGYKPTTISLVAENNRIAKRFDVLGKLYQALSAEGIRKAMSVVAAARMFENMSYEWRNMAAKAMLWKLWKDYGGCERLHQREAWLEDEMKRTDDRKRYQEMKKEADDIRSKYSALSQPVPFCASDFNGGPACYQVVDERYALELKDHFMNIMNAAPKPAWPEPDDLVRIKDAGTANKYQGKKLVDSIQPRLSAGGDRIIWVVAVRIGKYDCEYFLPERLEPVEDDKAKKKPKAKKKTAEPKRELTLEEQLRKALQSKLAA